MRNQIISRCAAGAFGVCFAYALIRQPFAVLKNPDAIKDWGDAATTAIIETTLPPVTLPATTVPETLPSEPVTDKQEETTDALPSTIAAAEPPETGVPETAAPTEEDDPEEDDPDGRDDEDEESEEERSDEAQPSAQESTGGDDPTLSQFLSQLTCGGCRHRCLLVNPRCMKGRAKAESATVEYYEIYGA